jgi:isopentenyl diphosphate isomerase/L-lactate dehydrogenase-like FMN-dependent dehydrogenase
MARHERCHNVKELRDEARRRLPKWVFEMIDRGSEDEIAPRHNRAALDRLKLRNKVLVDISGRDLGTTLFGRRLGLPVAVAPTGAVGLCWYEGEVALARAAAAAGVPYTLATNSLTPLEKVAGEAGGQLWFQLYLYEDRQISYDLVRRAAKAGFEALVVTVDFGLGANREYNRHNGFNSPYRPNLPTTRDILLRPRWMTQVLFRYLATTGMPRNANNPPQLRNSGTKALRAETITWGDFARLRDVWAGTILIKGIMRPDDAERAVESGADGIVVSNHGGRNMDSAFATIDALPGIVDAVGDRTTVLMDSGIRRGSDIVKALALGARAVLVGRPSLWGAAAGGQAGAEHMFALLKREYELTLAYVGCRSAAELSEDVLATDEPFWTRPRG